MMAIWKNSTMYLDKYTSDQPHNNVRQNHVFNIFPSYLDLKIEQVHQSSNTEQKSHKEFKLSS